LRSPRIDADSSSKVFSKKDILSVVETTETKVFYFHVILDAVVGTFTTKPRLFDCLTPPNGATSFEMRPVLMPTIPLSRPSAAL